MCTTYVQQSTEALDPLELESQAFVSLHIVVPGMDSGSPDKAAKLLTTEPSLWSHVDTI